MYTLRSSKQLSLFPEKRENDKKTYQPKWQPSHWDENTWYLTTKSGYPAWDFKYKNTITCHSI